MSVQAPRCFPLSCLLFSLALGAGSRVDAFVSIAAPRHPEALIVNPDSPIGVAITPLSPRVNRISLNRIPTTIAPEFTSLVIALSPDLLELKENELTQKPAAIVNNATNNATGTDTNATNSDITDLNTTDTNTTDINATDINATDTNATDINATDTKATNTNITDINTTDTNTTDTNTTDTNTTNTNTTDINATDTDTNVTDTDTTDRPIPNPEAIATPVPAIPAAELAEPELKVTDTETLDLTEPVTPAAEMEANDLIDPDLQQEGDPELGILRLRERPLQRPSKPKFVFLTGSFSYFRSDNILSSEIDTIGDQLFGGRLILSARPIIGPQTLLVGAIEGNIIRYGDLSDLDYNGFGLKVGVRHFWSRQAYSELSWDNRQLFLDDDGDRFLNDHSFRLSMFYRVPLAPRLKLDNYYQFRWSVTDPTDRSRLVNRLGTVLDYDLTSTVQVSLNYQYDLTNFTQRDREDSYHQVIAQLGWDISRSIRLNIYGGYSFGASTASDVNFNGSILGAGMSFNLPLF